MESQLWHGAQINDSPSWQPKPVRTPGSTNQHIYLGFSPPPPSTAPTTVPLWCFSLIISLLGCSPHAPIYPPK